jgi:hypothetical protein
MERRPDRWPVAIVILAAVVCLLGAIGVSRTAASCRIDDCLYSALQLFAVQAPSGVEEPPLLLNVARFLAPLVLGYAVVLALLESARERATLWRLALSARNHVVVVGLTDVGLAAAIEARIGREDVVVTGADHDPRLLRACRAHRIDVVRSHTEYPGMLRAARADRAETVIIATGDDTANLRALAAVHELTAGARRGFSYTEITDVRLWAALHSLPLTRDTAAHEEFFCPPDRAARIVLDHCRFEVDGSASVLVYGRGPVAERLVVQTARRAQAQIQLGGPGAAALLESVLATAPWLEPRVAVAADGHAADVALVAGLPDAEALAVPRSLVSASVGRVWAAISDPAAIDAAALMDLDIARVRLVQTTPAALATRLLDESALELIARAKHENYLNCELRRGVSKEANPSLVEWRELPESLRRSNRMFAASVGEKLADLGAQLEPIADDPTPGPLAIADDVLDELAQQEHQRWMRDLLADGWRYTDGPKEADNRLHPSLVQWEQLAADEQEKDRDAIRALPAMLALVGYRVRMPQAERV